jgi:hypothetical protein
MYRTACLTSCFVLSFVINSTAQAGIMNGDFSAGGSGWDASTDVEFVGGAAKLNESSSFSPTTLSQIFTIEQGTTSLQIQLLAFTTETSALFSLLPDSLTFSLLDPTTNASLTNTVPFTTNFFIRDLVDDVPAGEAAGGVTVSVGLPITIAVDLTALAASQPVNAKLLFELVGGGDFFDASYTVDNISLLSPGLPPPSGGVIPEPSSLLVWASFAVVGFGARRSRKSSC